MSWWLWLSFGAIVMIGLWRLYVIRVSRLKKPREDIYPLW